MSDITDNPGGRATPGDDSAGSPPGIDSVVPAWVSSPTLDALQELVDVAALVPHEVARAAGLSTSELHSLRHLMDAPMGPVELAHALGVTSAASSGVVDRLVARGHAERRPHPGDGRRTQVVITDSGRREVFTRLAPMFSALAALDAGLGDDHREALERYLRGATAAMRAVM